MKKRKAAFIITGCLLIAGISYGVTYSYLTANDSTVNEFQIGRNEIEVTEEFEPPKGLEPGVSFTKKPYVTNTGNIACWVRMRADFSDSKMEDLCEYTINTPTLAGVAGWTEKQADGYYYYTEKLKPGDTTVSLFTGESDNIEISSEAIPTDLVNFDIIIYAESCGAEKGDTYQKAWGI